MVSPGFPPAPAFHTVPGRGQPRLSCRRSRSRLGSRCRIPAGRTAGLSAAPACAPGRSCRPSAADRLPPAQTSSSVQQTSARALCRGPSAAGSSRCRGRSRGDCTPPGQSCRCRQQGTDLPQVPMAEKKAVGAGSCPRRPAPPGGQRIRLQLHAGDLELGLPLQQQKAQKSGARRPGRTPAAPAAAGARRRGERYPSPAERARRRKQSGILPGTVDSQCSTSCTSCAFPIIKKTASGRNLRGHLRRSDLAGGRDGASKIWSGIKCSLSGEKKNDRKP